MKLNLKNFFGSLDHEWLLKFVKLRVKDPRIITLIKRWLKAGVMEEGELKASDLRNAARRFYKRSFKQFIFALRTGFMV